MEKPVQEQSNRLTKADYPLGQKSAKLLYTATDKAYETLTLESALNGEITKDDIRISPKTLEMHAEISESIGRAQLGQNFRRAAEMIAISDARILEIYNALRPNRSTKEELLAIADELESEYNAVENAKLVREAADVYERRGRLREIED